MAARKGKKGGPAPEVGIEVLGMPRAAGGMQCKVGDTVRVAYEGRLRSNGKVFDSSAGRDPIQFVLGRGKVIKGWDLGVVGMVIGEKRRLTIPAALAYGDKAVGGGLIPANSDLVFEVELKAIIPC